MGEESFGPSGSNPAGTLALIQMLLSQMAQSPEAEGAQLPVNCGLTALHHEAMAEIRKLLADLAEGGGGCSASGSE